MKDWKLGTDVGARSTDVHVDPFPFLPTNRQKVQGFMLVVYVSRVVNFLI